MSIVQFQGRGRAGPAEGQILAALDIGSSKISCLIAQAQPARHRMPGAEDRTQLKILGVGHQASRGVRCGAINDLDEAERAVRLAVDAAERMARATVTDVYLNVSGGRPQSTSHSATVPISGHATPRDVEHVVTAAFAGADPGRRSVLHVTPVQFQIDDAKGVKSPVGLHGSSLGVDIGVVTVDPAHLNNLGQVVERAHLRPAGFVIAPYAAARAVLTDDELCLGVTLIEMGSATTSYAVFFDGNLVLADTLPIGGHHITTDLARGLSTTIAHAERMKTLWGSALASSIDDRDMVTVPILGERGADAVHKIPKSMLTGIIRPRIEEIFELLRDRLMCHRLAHLGGRRAVLSGGASQLTGIREVAMEWLDKQVRLSGPLAQPGLPDAARSPGFAVCAGLLNYALKPDHLVMPQGDCGGDSERGRHGYMRRVGRWIVDSL